MRVWDVHPGYLNDRSLLGEHLETHAIYAVIRGKLKGYACHPETLRWKRHLNPLKLRHRLCVAEMRLRGFKHRSDLAVRGNTGTWPTTFVDTPDAQFAILKAKYRHKADGRIPLPKNTQQAWAHHKYSVLARSPECYRKTGRMVAGGKISFASLILMLVELLRLPPPPGRAMNALEHMWGYVAPHSTARAEELKQHPRDFLDEIARCAVRGNVAYLTASTALSDLGAWRWRDGQTRSV